ncbi:MAG TPA: hypothetical protein VE548_06560 [Nitrososphaeraceae archaeon]|nr:hypothetical protein [Nitrososphaeraceae archaeon]
MEKSPDDTMNLKLYPSLISKARVAFDNRKTYLNYFRKLAQEQGIGFLIGIAFGVNLILLLQMSEDIISNLSETLANSIIVGLFNPLRLRLLCVVAQLVF